MLCCKSSGRRETVEHGFSYMWFGLVWVPYYVILGGVSSYCHGSTRCAFYIILFSLFVHSLCCEFHLMMIQSYVGFQWRWFDMLWFGVVWLLSDVGYS